ncbi:MAG: WYL domain-containing protein [Candidatus Sungiibacteriota bacterium]|uniref:WYL domain-containing protein n=1 Tax=Candidatus Sungiibacteriota bacterium TaxID=2750080 RepID=A0A7T5RIS4_9BACT|nr:MAG: WYL domain-containing protein [Candidatus Sungbacteria bacterium]
MRDTLVIDIETKKSFAEVGGEKNIRELGISVAGVYSYAKDAFFAFEEQELPKLEDLLSDTGHIIGFNINHFDIPVMEPYLDGVSFAKFAVTDMFEDAVNFLGHRVGLDGLAKATLGSGKTGHGLEALEWFKQGRIEEVKKYCLDDVRLTRDLYEYGKKHDHLLFESFIDGKIHSIPVSWGKEIKKPILQILEEAFDSRQRLSIEYVSSEDSDGLGFKKARLIDVYKIKPNGEIEAYCHLRQGLRNFRINRILKAEPTSDSYSVPQDFQHTLFT